MPRAWMMRRWPFWLVMGVAIGLAPGASTLARGEVAASRKTPVVEAVAKAMPSVVSITSERRASTNSRWPYSAEESRKPRVNGMGTGVILDERGFILTNQHVVHEVNDLRVFLSDGTSFPAQVVQQDDEMDLALLKIDAGKPVTAIRVGASDDLMVGEQVITIGNAFGYENTTSIGIISALKRNVTLADDQVYRNLIQTDAGINPGNSGGPLINIDGELVGINVATRAGAQGIGFALPIDDVKRVAVGMLSTRRLAGTWHGLVATESHGTDGSILQVSKVEQGSPAEQAGVQAGDVVQRINQLEIANAIDVERALLGIRPGDKAKLVVLRGGEAKELDLQLQGLGSASTDAAEKVWTVLGLKAVRVPAEYVTPASDKLRGGLYIQDVLAGSVAERAYLRKGDILVGMHLDGHDWETVRPENLLFILKQSSTVESPQVKYYIVRKNVIHQGQIDLAGVGDTGSVLR